MKTIADLIELLKTLPPDARVAHFDVYKEEDSDLPRIYYGTLDGQPTLWTEYDSEQVTDDKQTVGELWDDLNPPNIDWFTL